MQIKEIKAQEGQTVSTDTVLLTTVAGEEIKPGIAGEVSSIEADENAQLMPGAKLIDIVDYSDLQLKVQVDEYDLSANSDLIKFQQEMRNQKTHSTLLEWVFVF